MEKPKCPQCGSKPKGTNKTSIIFECGSEFVMKGEEKGILKSSGECWERANIRCKNEI